MTARSATPPLRLASPARLRPPAEEAPRDDVLLPVLGLVVGLVPWIGLRLCGRWSEPELALAGLMALAAAAELLRLLARALHR